MSLVKFYVIFCIIHSVFCETKLYGTPCDVLDSQCVRRNIIAFNEMYSGGIPKYDIEPIDPMVIPSVTVQLSSDKPAVLNEVSVVGLKNMRFINSTLEKEAGTVRMDLDLFVELHGHIDANNVSSVFSSKTAAQPMVHYKYNLEKDDKGVEHINVGKETIACKDEYTPEFDVNDKFAKALFQEQKTADEIKKKIVCKAVEVAITRVLNNFRTLNKILPTSAFFANL